MTQQQTHKHGGGSGISAAFWLNVVFSLIEFAGGVFTNSNAILADAFHDFMDAVAIGIAARLEKYSHKKRSATFSYGYKRFSLVAALGISLLLLTGVIFMVVSAVNSFFAVREVRSAGMMWLAVLGIAVNSFGYLLIKKRGDKGHSHSPGNNSKAIMLHLLEDVLGWIAVLAGAIVIHFTAWHWIDGVLTLGIALFIGYNALKNLIATMRVFLQSVPDNVDIENLTKELSSLEGVGNIHDVHVWSLDGNYNVGSLHVVLKPGSASAEKEIFGRIIRLLHAYNVQHPTVQIENSADECSLADH